jgi:undecaprenyl-diphosphatase
MVGAGVLAVFDLDKITNLASFVMPMLVGFITSAIVGYFAIRWLLNYLGKNSLYIFSIYLVVFSLLSLILR